MSVGEDLNSSAKDLAWGATGCAFGFKKTHGHIGLEPVTAEEDTTGARTELEPTRVESTIGVEEVDKVHSHCLTENPHNHLY